MKQESKTRRTYAEHGIPLEAVGANQYRGDSPFAKPGHGARKFYVHKLTGLWDDKSTALSGNLQKFFEEKSKRNEAAFRGAAAQALAKDRQLPIRALRAFRLGWDGRQYTIPLAATGKAYDLRRYPLGGKERATTGARLSLAGVTVPDAETVYLAEGCWDACAVWEMLQVAGETASVYAVPGAGSFPQHAIPLFQGKRVRVLYDNDEAGHRGTLRVQKNLSGVTKALQFLNWPEDLPDGFDVRDFYVSGRKYSELIALLKNDCPGGLAEYAAPPVEAELAKLTGPGLAPAHVLKRYRKYLYLPHPEVLDVLYGAVFANRMDGDPIWLFLVAPPGGTKTELILSLSDAPLIRTLSSLTPHTLVSGAFRQNGEGDPSLLPQLNGRVLGLKDFTTILNMPQQARDEIFGTLREVYDGRFEKSWGTGLSRRYDAKFGIIAGVTPVIEKFAASSSVLGERFIKYRIPRTTRLQSDDSVIDAALANLNRETEMRKALQATAKAVLDRPVGKESAPALDAAIRVKIRKLAQWVSRLRGVVMRERYTRQIEYKPTAEVGTRLAKQFAKLAQGIALYHFKAEVDEEIYQIVLSIARGTIPDRPEELVRQLYLAETEMEDRGAVCEGFGTEILAKQVGLDTGTVRLVLQDLELLKIVRLEKHKRGKPKYRLARATKALMNDLNLYKKEGGWRYARRKAKAEPRGLGRHLKRAARKTPKRRAGAGPAPVGPKTPGPAPARPPRRKPKRRQQPA